MARKDIYKLAGKSVEQVRQAFVTYMGDKNATTKQIKNANSSNYAKIGTKQIVIDIVKKIYSKESIFDLRTSEMVQNVSNEISEMIECMNAKPNELKELKNVRSYVNKYKDFLEYCESLSERELHKKAYDFTKDEDKPFIAKDYFFKIVSLLRRKKNVILEGAPGVGKTFLARKLAYQLIGEIKDSNIEMIQFHQSYSYEDFVQGVRPTENGTFEVRNGVFYDFCQKARKADEPFVFIIDEMNRGNLSKILGEMMLLLEVDKRSSKYAVKLTYGDVDEKFYIPDNIYIIGCMNTSDRSLAIVDYALRRRFVFCQILPEFNAAFTDFLAEKVGIENAQKVVLRVKRANELISATPFLGKGMEIGHSYFCHPKDTTETVNFEQWWTDICEYELFPYIKEICFDNEDLCEELCNILK